MKRRITPVIVFSAGLSLVSLALAAVQAQTTVTTFAGGYTALQAEQKRLVDDWFRRFSETIGKPVDPAEGYDRLPLSAKTTFYAVTHALLHTPLTDASGAALSDSAISLIEKVESVAGKVPRSRGDRQFRIYVELRPGTVELLGKSQQFKRAIDNTVYHKGYPVCFRSGGVPSIQVSTTRDGTRADIDVDYRSSSFPAFLFNGHLSASNSDVRAGNNYVRHNEHWAGLRNWWRTLLGLPYDFGSQSVDQALSEEVIPTVPKVKAKSPEAAVYDFLNSWLVEGRPNDAMAYFTPDSLSCIEVERGEPVDRGMSKFVLLKGLQEINRKIGPVASLSDAVEGVRLTGPRIQVIQQPHHAQFVLYRVRADLAEEFNCAAKLDPETVSVKDLLSNSFGRYVGAVFHLKTSEETGGTVATIWRKEKGYWKLVSYDVEPQFEDFKVPQLGTPPESAALSTVRGDSALIKASKDFLEKWFVRDQVEQAFSYVSAQCYPCANLYLPENTPAPNGPGQAAELIRQGMTRMAEAAGKVNRLDKAITAAIPSNPDIKIVRHAEYGAYAIASLPDYIGEQADCGKRSSGELTFKRTENPSYGNYYAVGFRLVAAGEDGATLWILWKKEGMAWKVVAYSVLTP